MKYVVIDGEKVELIGDDPEEFPDRIEVKHYLQIRLEKSIHQIRQVAYDDSMGILDYLKILFLLHHINHPYNLLQLPQFPFSSLFL